MATSTSRKLIPFLVAHEGFVSKAYRDPGGVVTIGTGFTNLSRVFSDYWRAKRGRALKMGDTISRAEADEVLEKLLAEEYAPPVVRLLGDRPQHQIDGSASAVYNCGAGTLKDRWAAALKAGRVSEAATLLRSTRVTQRGVGVLRGLVRRRAEEARLIEFGVYGDHVVPIGTGGSAPTTPPPSVSTSPEEVRAYQSQLKTLGYPIEATGVADAATILTVGQYQRSVGLDPDGSVGPATRARLKRDVAAINAVKGGGATVPAAGGGGGGAIEGAGSFDWIAAGKWAALAALVGFALFMAWRYRGVILRKRTPA